MHDVPTSSCRHITHNPKFFNGDILTSDLTYALLCSVEIFGHTPLVEFLAEHIVEDNVGRCLCQLQRHEPLTIMEELELVGVWGEDAPPCLGAASARQILDRTANEETL